MKTSSITRIRNLRTVCLWAALTLSGSVWAASPDLIQPNLLIVDKSIDPSQLKLMELAARRYDTFWNTGNEELARQALAPDFIDKTPPPDRKQGPAGPLLASQAFRKAVPDLSSEIEQMIIAGDRVVAHLHFRGHFTGSFGDINGKGQTVDFIATDIYQIKNGKISANWHLEDNLTLMKQLGAL